MAFRSFSVTQAHQTCSSLWLMEKPVGVINKNATLLCGICAAVSIAIALTGIFLQLKNYRKPSQQRLIVRIQMIVPLFAVTCYTTFLYSSDVLSPIREVYEAFVIYTFFSLLTTILGGERSVAVKTSGREPVSHLWPLNHILPAFDISDPHTFLAIKRGILQYVWVKPFLCFAIAITQVVGLYDVNDFGLYSAYLWITILYNTTVTLSLYSLAIFWKSLYDDLKPFRPWGKFLCVKLIIFASYWQGALLGLLNWLGFMAKMPDTMVFQSGLLCLEVIPFAVGHWYAFSYKEFDMYHLPNCGKVLFFHALKDCCGMVDLYIDFKMTYQGESYRYQNFDSVEALISHPASGSRATRIQSGMRYVDGGSKKYWLPVKKDALTKSSKSLRYSNFMEQTVPLLQQKPDSISSIRGLYMDEQDGEWTRDDEVYDDVRANHPFGDRNYPVTIEPQSHLHSAEFRQKRREALQRQGMV